jgi:predicted GNAT superfamily acetyltransferase
VILALDRTNWIGFSMTSIQQAEGFAFSEMTGVLAGYRGRGISLALKVLAIDFVRRSGQRWLRTFHHPANEPAIAMNRRLGFVDDP